MGLRKLKKKLFSKSSSAAAAATVPDTQARTFRIQETLIAHGKSQIHLHPPASLVSHDSASEASNTVHQPEGRDLRRPDLLLKVLPIIKGLIVRCEEYSNDYASQNGVSFYRTPKFAYLGHASAAISLLEEYLQRIQESGQADGFDDTLTQLAQCLESMLGYSDTSTSHHVLSDLLRQSKTSSRDAILFKEAQKNVNAHGSEDWKRFSQSLATFTDQLQRVGQDVKDEKLEQDRAAILRRPLPEVGEFIGRAFAVMTCSCNLHSTRELSLRLCTYKGFSATVLPGIVTVLSKELGRPPKQWAEIQVHASHEIHFEGQAGNVKLVKTAPPSQDIPSATRSPSFPLENTACICDCYKTAFSPSDFWRLNIRLHDSTISKWWADKRVLSPTALQHQVNLRQLISPTGSTMSGIAKMTLPVFLAYSIFYLYGGSWARGGWKRENIVFFAEGNDIPMRPFLRVPPPSSDASTSSGDGMSFHRFPEFLELGVMLLEIHFGQSLEAMLGKEEEIVTVNDYFAAASEIYEKRKLDIISRGLRHAIESCLKPDFNMDLGMEDPDDDELRSKIFETVVHPLEEELERAFQDFISVDSLDDEASTKIRLPFKPSTLAPLLGVKAGQDEHRSRRRSPMKHTRIKLPACVPQLPGAAALGSGACPISTAPRSFELFSNESKTTEPELGVRTETDSWMERFESLIDEFLIDADEPSNLGNESTSRLKVAILDTGIDMNHDEIFGEERIKECKSWTGTLADEDASGHGTHIASTILNLTRNVDLYIAKVTESNVLEDAHHISDAINFACDVWKVDMISMSFGFQQGMPSIQRAINRAVSDDRNVIVFAAASNDASNSDRAYPASHDRVICVHSADGHGNRSLFNPTAREGSDNFCVVGENVEAAWPKGQTQYPGVRRMSGTSFATPIGVAVAAFMLGFVRQRLPGHTEWLNPLKSYLGVRAVFRALSQKRDSGYLIVNPLHKFSRGEDGITEVLSSISNELRR